MRLFLLVIALVFSSGVFAQSTYLGTAPSSVPASYPVIDEGWNFCGPFQTPNTCSVPAVAPGLSYGTLQSAANGVEAANSPLSTSTWTLKSIVWPAQSLAHWSFDPARL